MSHEPLHFVARRIGALLLLTVCVAAQEPAGETPARADGVFYVASLSELPLEDGKLPLLPPPYQEVFSARATLDGPGDVYVLRAQTNSLSGFRRLRDETSLRDVMIAIHLPEARPLRGRLFLPVTEEESVIVGFHLGPEAFGTDHRTAFYEQERRHHGALMRASVAGTAWWRHRHDEGVEALGDEMSDDDAQNLRRTVWRDSSTVEDSFALFTGGRAVSENLQLDRLLPAARDGDAVVPIDTIDGITMPEYDWSELIDGLAPETDPLAILIPEDQHAIFFPSFGALIELTDHANDLSGPVLDAFGNSAADSGSRTRTERQLGLPMSTLARLLGPTVIRSVAFTGSDPYLRTGTDVALLFEAVNVKLLHALISTRLSAALLEEKTAERSIDTVGEIAYALYITPDRSLCSYVAPIGDTVVVTNSLDQLRRLVAVWKGELGSLAALPEYTFFRDRYRRHEGDETALLVLSDATIRRWCGPRWRIGSSRRTRAAASLAELQAELIDAPVHADTTMAAPPPGLGEVTLTPDGPRSSAFGALAFLTPIIELDLDLVSEVEADLYLRWRMGYQDNWTGVFDPIAVRFSVGAERIALDLTVRPLIASSEYADMIEMAAGSEIDSGAGDPHDDAILQWTMAVDPESNWFGRNAGMLTILFPQMDPLAWLGRSVTIFADDSPFWDDLLASEDDMKFFFANVHRMPLAFHAEVRSNLLLATFLVGVRALIEQSAPGMMRWENNTWREEPYVIIQPTEQAPEDVPEEAAIHYVASGQGLLVTMSEELLQRAIDRRIARREAAANEAAPVLDDEPIGRHVLVSANHRFFEIGSQLVGKQFLNPLRQRSFSNLPILNEWKRLRPDDDPVAFHERVWHQRLVCPGGGEYRWNEQWQTMESSVFGHPLAPRQGPGFAPILRRISSAAAGLTFEGNGLRARAQIQFEPR